MDGLHRPAANLIPIAFILWAALAVPAPAQTVYTVPSGGYALEVAKRWYLDPDAEPNHLRLLPPSKSGGSLLVRAHCTLTPAAAFIEAYLEKELASIEGATRDGELEAGPVEGAQKAVIRYKQKRKDVIREYVFLPAESRIVVALYECQKARMSSTRDDVDAMLGSLQLVDVKAPVKFDGEAFAFTESPARLELLGQSEPRLQKKRFTGGRAHVWNATGEASGSQVILLIFDEDPPEDFDSLRKRAHDEFVAYSNVKLKKKETITLHGREAYRVHMETRFDQATRVTHLCAFLGSDAAYVVLCQSSTEDEGGFRETVDHFLASIRVP